MENPIRSLLVIVAVWTGFCIGCGGSGNDPSKVEGTINSVSAEGIAADALAMSRVGSIGARAGYFTEHDPALSSCSSGQVSTITNNMETLSLIYDACMIGAVTWDGRIVMSSNSSAWPYEIDFGDAANSLMISQSEPTLAFPYLDIGQVLTLKGDMQVYDHAEGYEYLMQGLNVYYNTCYVGVLNADLYIGYDEQTQAREVIFSGQIYSNLIPDIECFTTRRFVAEEQNYPSDGAMLITALDDGSNVFVIANTDASTVTLRIDTDNDSLTDNEILTTWNSLKNNVDPSLQELFEFFWRY